MRLKMAKMAKMAKTRVKIAKMRAKMVKMRPKMAKRGLQKTPRTNGGHPLGWIVEPF